MFKKSKRPMAEYIWEIEARRAQRIENMKANACIAFIVLAVVFAEPLVYWLVG